jgi:hypothetical protein
MPPTDDPHFLIEIVVGETIPITPIDRGLMSVIACYRQLICRNIFVKSETMNRRRSCVLGMWLAFAVGCTHTAPSGVYSSQPTAQSLSVDNASGVTVRVATEHSDPSLWLDVSDEPAGQDAVLVLVPEHVTVRRRGRNEAEHLYLSRPDKYGSRSSWTRVRNTLQYEKEFAPGMHFLAQVSLESDGVLYHYEFVNHSDVDFDSVQAITDPRMISPLFRDVRLERTYVHGQQGFVLLASDMPERLTMPLDQWLPNRYRISYAWPVEKTRVQKQADGITFFNASNRADEPVMATLSTDRHWIMATFSRNPGNLWTNPDLTCQHADPEITLPHHSEGIVEEKMLLFRGTLDMSLTRFGSSAQR